MGFSDRVSGYFKRLDGSHKEGWEVYMEYRNDDIEESEE